MGLTNRESTRTGNQNEKKCPLSLRNAAKRPSVGRVLGSHYLAFLRLSLSHSPFTGRSSQT